MKLIEISCEFCKKKFKRSQGRFHESKKYGWRSFCSLECQSKFKNKHIERTCENPLCQRIFWRQPKETKKSAMLFCSQTCAAFINNILRGLKRPLPKCARETCRNLASRSRQFCSSMCHGATIKIPTDAYKQKIISSIRDFYTKHERIPLKKELMGKYRTARKLFGTWNNAIKTAGFEPNPVKFSKKHIAKDGHICDSMAEKIIDDWLSAKNIPHERNVPYEKSKRTADFRVGNTLIEFFGLVGELKEYDNSIAQKEKIWLERELTVIKLYPKDILSQNALNRALSNL